MRQENSKKEAMLFRFKVSTLFSFLSRNFTAFSSKNVFLNKVCLETSLLVAIEVFCKNLFRIYLKYTKYNEKIGRETALWVEPSSLMALLSTRKCQKLFPELD